MNVFDIIGPVMIGPSSSHTAGAARIGIIARELLGNAPKTAVVTLHDSFARTSEGHGTDRAIIGGILGFGISDARIKDSFRYAKEAGLSFRFMTSGFGNVHPNTVKIKLEDEKKEKVELIASSTGGGRIEVLNIDGASVSFSAEYHTLVIAAPDILGTVAEVSGLLASKKINIAFMRLFREGEGARAIMVIEIDQAVGKEDLESIKGLWFAQKVSYIRPFSAG